MCRKLTWLVSLVLLLGLGHSASAQWKASDPIIEYEKKIIRKGIISEAYAKRKRAAFRRATLDAIEKAKKAPWPKASELLRNVYAK